MKCTMSGCAGEYELQAIVHTVKQRGEVVTFDHVPAEVCKVCGDVQFAPETVRRMEVLLKTTPPPRCNITFHEFA